MSLASPPDFLNDLRRHSVHDTKAPILSSAATDATRFDELGLIEPLLRAIRQVGHERPTPIQARAIPHVLAGRDLFGCAQTGTGKTAAFVLPILQQMLQRPAPAGRPRTIRALVLTPTRELASQIETGFARYGRFTGLRQTVVFGGVGQAAQVSTLRAGVDVLVATPGRLCDLLAQGLIRLDHVEFFVLDEADRMLDEGFLPAIRKVVAVLPRQRQTLLFSATMPPEIAPLAAQVLRDPLHVQVAPVASTPDAIAQSVYFVDQQDKRALLHHLLGAESITRAIVFTRTKHGADRVARQLSAGEVDAEAIHGNKSQNARERALARFREGKLRVLVATDLAARGIDITGISHVINYDLPMDPEGYVHRIGRTARAGTKGVALSFCSGEEQTRLKSIERLMGRRVPVAQGHPYAATGAVREPAPAARREPARPAPRAPAQRGGPRQAASDRGARPQARRDR